MTISFAEFMQFALVWENLYDHERSALRHLRDGDFQSIQEDSETGPAEEALASLESAGVDVSQQKSELADSAQYLGRRSGSRVVTAALSAADKQAITNEAGSATNLHKLNLKGTHYVGADEEVVNDDSALFL